MTALSKITRRTFLASATGMAILPRGLRAQGSIRSVVIAGARGRTGRLIAEKALAAGYTVRGLTRNPERAREQYGDGIEWLACDVRNPNDVGAALQNMDAVFCAIGYTEFAGPNGAQFVDYLGVRHLVDDAVEQKAKHFVLISSGASGLARDHSDYPQFGYVGYWKTKAEDRLKKSGLPYTIVGPAGLIDEPGGTKAIRIMRRPDYLALPMARRNIDIGDVATVAVASLNDPALENKAFAMLNGDDPPSDDWRQTIAQLEPEAPWR